MVNSLNGVSEEYLIWQFAAQKLGQKGIIEVFIEWIKLVAEHDDFLLCLLRDFGADFGPNGVKKHGCVDQIHSKSIKNYLYKMLGK